MLRISRILSIFVLATLILSACQPVMPEVQVAAADQTEAVGIPHTPRQDAPPYGVSGPHAVGVRDFTIEGTEEYSRSITVSVWYPALNPTSAPEEVIYEMDITPGEQPPFPVYGRALQDAEPDRSAGPYPLVIFSHGAFTFRQSSAYLLEHLASQGFAVIAPDHLDNWGTLFQQTHISEIYRPIELRRTLDYAEALTSNGGTLAGLIDMERVAAAGYSFGGEEALILAGARLNLDEFFTFCEAKDNPIGDCAYTEFVDEMVQAANLNAPPTGLWPDWSDPRIDAVVSIAPGAYLFGETGMQAVDVPVLFMETTEDELVGPGLTYFATYNRLPSERKSRVTFEDANHLLFVNSCAANPGIVEQGFFWVCSDPVWDMDRAHDLVNHFTSAFLLAELKGDADAAAALAPENVAFPGITYETTAYASSVALDDVTVKLESILTDIMQTAGVPGYAMCIVKDGNVVYNKGFGVTNVGGDQPMTPQSVFITYSTTKSFTAVALMQLVEEGKVDLDAPVTTYLPDFTMADPGYEQITVRMLASHTSGLIDDAIFQNMPPKSEEPAEIGAAIQWFVSALADDTLTAAPPTAWQYASTNFILLGDIIGNVSGEPYDVYVTKHILEPLAMAHSTLDAATIPSGALVGEHSTTVEGAVGETAQSYSSRFDTPAGGIYSTCEDMTRWMQVHLNRGELDGVRILQAKSYDILWNKEAPTGLDEFFGTWIEGYGLGWTVAEDGGHFLAGHPGGGAGQTSGYQLAPDDNLGVTVLANWGMDDAFPAWTAAANVLYALLGIEPQ